MTYYKVPQMYDGFNAGRGWRLIAGELWTATELKRHHLSPSMLIEVKVPKNRVYWLFGARWEDKN